MNLCHVFVPLLLAAFASVAVAQCSVSTDPVSTSSEKYLATPLKYPMTSDRYGVQYSVNGGAWTNAKVYISYYGGTNASPWRRDSGYSLPYQLPDSSTSPVRPDWETSMSFVSIPAAANARVRLRVSKLFGDPFNAGDHVAVRPSAKGIDVDQDDGTVEISTETEDDFSGEQFILWEHGAEGAAIEGLAFFLDPPYQPPSGNVKTIKSWNDLNGANLDAFEALDFEGPDPIELGGTGMQAFAVPANIKYVFLGPNAWVQGKLRFSPRLEPAAAFQADPTRWLYGTGVLDVSRFRYDRRVCHQGEIPDDPDEGLYAVTSTGNPLIQHLNIDGIIIIDHNHAAAEALSDSLVNNVKTLGWNGENAALRLQDHTTVSNVFVRSGDDSLMMWGSPVSVKNATVWQNYNGGVVNLGWSDNSPGDYNLLDGLYVVKTDWQIPTDPSWIALDPADHPLQGQNNAVFASLMSPGTNYGKAQPPVFRNIFLEDRPQVLFSLKIIPPICSPSFLVCRPVTLTKDSFVKLRIENLFTPVSIVDNLIGFQTLPADYTQDSQNFPTDYTLTGSMKLDLTNVFIRLPDGSVKALTSENADAVGKLETSGDNVDIDIDRHDERRPDRDRH